MYKVLIADDEPKVSQLIKNLIMWETLGIELIGIAHDGRQALELIGMYHPDIVITDIRMPGCDGIELIKKGKALNPETDFIIISGYQHFDYAHNAIKYDVKDYLLKPLKKHEINETLQRITKRYEEERAKTTEKKRLIERISEDAQRIREAFINDLFNHPERLPLDEDRSILNEMYHLHLTQADFSVVEIKPDIELNYDISNVQEMLIKKVVLITANHMSKLDVEFFVHGDAKCVRLIVNAGAERRREIRRALHRIIDESQGQTELFKGIRTTIGIASHAGPLNTLSKAIITAHQCVLDRLVIGSGQIIEHPVSIEVMDVEDVLNRDLRRELARSTEALCMEGINQVIDQVETILMERAYGNGASVKKILDEIIRVVLYTLNQQMSAQHLEKHVTQRFNQGFDMCHKVGQAFLWLKESLGELMSEVLDAKESEYLKPIQEAQQYIHERFNQTIKLEDVSAIVGFNPTYFSTLFKKETGTSFLNYVTDVRMKEAKKQLSDLTKTIADISMDVGYQDLKHFNKQFKKATGLTPSKYRKLYY